MGRAHGRVKALGLWASTGAVATKGVELLHAANIKTQSTRQICGSHTLIEFCQLILQSMTFSFQFAHPRLTRRQNGCARLSTCLRLAGDSSHNFCPAGIVTARKRAITIDLKKMQRRHHEPEKHKRRCAQCPEPPHFTWYQLATW